MPPFVKSSLQRDTKAPRFRQDGAPQGVPQPVADADDWLGSHPTAKPHAQTGDRPDG